MPCNFQLRASEFFFRRKRTTFCRDGGSNLLSDQAVDSLFVWTWLIVNDRKFLVKIIFFFSHKLASGISSRTCNNTNQSTHLLQALLTCCEARTRADVEATCKRGGRGVHPGWSVGHGLSPIQVYNPTYTHDPSFFSYIYI